MASFLYPCTNGCGKMVRFMSIWDIPKEVICDPCVAAIAANKAGAEGRWVHKGGGYYVHTETGEKRRGKPA